MSPLITKHNLRGNILGEIEFAKPMTFRVVYPDNVEYFTSIVKFTAMKTGCSVLTDKDDGVTVLVCGHRYYSYKPTLHM